MPAFVGLSLYGVSASVQGAKQGKKGKRGVSQAQRGGLLFTHQGFSGPAILDLSHHAVMAMLRGTSKPGGRATYRKLCHMLVLEVLDLSHRAVMDGRAEGYPQARWGVLHAKPSGTLS